MVLDRLEILSTFGAVDSALVFGTRGRGFETLKVCRARGPMDKAPAYGAGDYEFESRRAFTSEMTYFLTLSRVV